MRRKPKANGSTRSNGRALVTIDPAYEQAVRKHERALPDLIPRYEQMRQALAECCRLDEAKNIGAKASALQAYARQVQDHQAETYMAEIKKRALRRFGEIYLGMEKAHGPGRGHKTLASDGKSFELKAVKVSPSFAHRAVVAFKIPEEEFDRYLAECREQHRPARFDEMVKTVVKRQRIKGGIKTRPWTNNTDDLFACDPAARKVSDAAQTYERLPRHSIAEQQPLPSGPIAAPKANIPVSGGRSSSGSSPINWATCCKIYRSGHPLNTTNFFTA